MLHPLLEKKYLYIRRRYIMANTVIGAQLFTLREFTKTPEDIANTLKRVKKIGYDAVQVSGMGPIDPQELKEIIDREELTICATHIGMNELRNDLDGVIKKHKLWGCKYVGLGSMPAEYRTDREGYVKFAKEISEIAKRLKESGLQFIYHNHKFEFEKFDGTLGLDILLSESDPEFVDFEIDTFWVQAGGGDPAAWIRKVKNRMKVVHLKDMAIKEDKQIMAEVGEGNLNWPSILQACKDIGVEWYVIEQDICQRDPFESLAISLKNVKAMGLK